MEKTKKLLIDCSFIWGECESSDSAIIYAINLIKGFSLYSSYRPFVLMWSKNEESLSKMIGFEIDKIIIDNSDLLLSWRPLYRFFGFLPHCLKEKINRIGFSCIILPYHFNGLFYFSSHYQHYAIVHDLFKYDNIKAKRGTLSYLIWRLYRRLLTQKFQHLISISKYTHDELIRRDGLKSDIVYNSIPFDFSIIEKSVMDVSGIKYIIDINRFQQYKNAEILIRALHLLRNKIPHYLYLKGDCNYAEDRKALVKLVSELGLEERVIFDMDYRTKGELCYLYKHADLFVSPSLKEGFGWTPIEAAILKTPVLISNIEVFKDVSCNKLTTFDPHSPEDLARHILDMLNNPPSEEERTLLSEFFLDRYSLKNQIEQFTQIIERDRKSCR